jgi:hypothetical protein
MVQQSLSPFPLKNTVPPFANVNQNLVNSDASNWAGGFSSKATSLEFGLPNPFRNTVAAAGASKIQTGGKRRTLRRKIKNIVKKYKMPLKKRRTMKRKLSRRLRGGFLLGRKSSGRKSSGRSRKQRGGIAPYNGGYTEGPYLAYKSDISYTPSFRGPGFAVGAGTGISSALANPLPIQRMAGGCGAGSLCPDNSLDNYNRYLNGGFQTTGFNTGFKSMNASVFG